MPLKPYDSNLKLKRSVDFENGNVANARLDPLCAMTPYVPISA